MFDLLQKPCLVQAIVDAYKTKAPRILSDSLQQQVNLADFRFQLESLWRTPSTGVDEEHFYGQLNIERAVVVAGVLGGQVEAFCFSEPDQLQTQLSGGDIILSGIFPDTGEAHCRYFPPTHEYNPIQFTNMVFAKAYLGYPDKVIEVGQTQGINALKITWV